MPAFNFNYITAPPADELVNEVTQLNDNLEQIESRLNYLQNLGGVLWPNVDRPKGLENLINVSTTQRTAVWDGAAWRNPGLAGVSWTAWSNITLTAPYVAVAGFTPQWRSNTGSVRRAQVRGRIQNGATGVPMNKAAWTNFNTGIALSFTPLNGSVIWTTSCSPIVAGAPVGSEINGARIRVNADGVSVRMDFNWMGQDSAATGNYISLDGLEWYC